MGYVGKVSSLVPPLLPRICSPLWVAMAPAIVLAEPGDVRLLGYSAPTGGARGLDHQSFRLSVSSINDHFPLIDLVAEATAYAVASTFEHPTGQLVEALHLLHLWPRVLHGLEDDPHLFLRDLHQASPIQSLQGRARCPPDSHSTARLQPDRLGSGQAQSCTACIAAPGRSRWRGRGRLRAYAPSRWLAGRSSRRLPVPRRGPRTAPG